jgi:hypothetical protein
MNDCAVKEVATIQCVGPLFESLVRSVTALAGVGLLIMLLIGGFNFLFSGGDPKKLEQARGTITQAVIGLIIMSIAYLILLTIEKFTGVTVTIFNLNIQ